MVGGMKTNRAVPTMTNSVLFAAALRCPRPQEGSVGTCVNRCSGNSNCSEGQSCCPGANGCASGCVNLVTVCHGPNGNVYQVNETFPARDRCNNW